MNIDVRGKPARPRPQYRKPLSWNDTGTEWWWRDTIGVADPATFSAAPMKTNHDTARG